MAWRVVNSAHTISAFSRLVPKDGYMAAPATASATATALTPAAAPAQTSFADSASSFPSPSKNSVMQVRKRNGSLENADVSKIVRAVERCCAGLVHVDPMRVASKTIGGLFNGATTKELDLLSIQTAASLISEEPEYSRLAARLLLGVVDKEVANQDIYSFSQSVTSGKQHGLVSEDLAKFVARKFPQVERRDRPAQLRTCSNILAYARSMTATCCAIPRPAMSWKRRNTSSCA